jgi:molybdenum cofactor cytidylyltransferase
VKAAGIILAAGESRRMGRPKALLPFRGGTFVSEIAENLARHCEPVIAVFGYDAANVMLDALGSFVRVENPDYKMGMLTSLQAGLRAVPEDCDAACFTLVDHPAVASSTVDALFRAEGPIVIPRCSGKRGHPVLVRRDIMEEFLAEPPQAKVRDVIDRHAAEIHYLEVDDPGISDDIDDPELYQQLLAREVCGR